MNTPFDTAHDLLLRGAEALRLASEIGNIPGITETFADKVEGAALPMREEAERLTVRLAGRDRDVECLTAIIGRNNLTRCPGCDRYLLRHEVCLHCEGKPEEINPSVGRLEADEIVWRLLETKKNREAVGESD